MKKFFKCAMILLLICLIPTLVACNPKDNKPKDEYLTLSIAAESIDFGPLEAPVKIQEVENVYAIKYDGVNLFYLQTEVNDFSKIVKGSIVNLVVYYTVDSELTEIKINQEDYSFTREEVNEQYSSTTINLIVTSNTQIDILGTFVNY